MNSEPFQGNDNDIGEGNRNRHQGNREDEQIFRETSTGQGNGSQGFDQGSKLSLISLDVSIQSLIQSLHFRFNR